MDIELTATEARIIGVLMEKRVTTPDQYPLTLNALVSGCNQKSSREPVMSLSPGTVQHALNRLRERHLVTSPREAVGRVERFQQRMCNTEFGALKFSPAEYAVICLLLLRGPQTLGELRSRSGRLHEFASLDETRDAVQSLSERGDGPFVARLDREPGRKDVRYAHLLGGTPARAAAAAQPSPVDEPRPPRPDAGGDRMAALEARVEALERALAELRDAR